MIHLGTNLLIALVNRFDAHHATATRMIAGPGPFATSSVAWREFHSRPAHPRDSAASKSVLNGGIAPFDESAAALAGDLFHLTGARNAAPGLIP